MSFFRTVYLGIPLQGFQIPGKLGGSSLPMSLDGLIKAEHCEQGRAVLKALFGDG